MHSLWARCDHIATFAPGTPTNCEYAFLIIVFSRTIFYIFFTKLFVWRCDLIWTHFLQCFTYIYNRVDGIFGSRGDTLMSYLLYL
jgi:hypothetical protein